MWQPPDKAEQSDGYHNNQIELSGRSGPLVPNFKTSLLSLHSSPPAFAFQV
jgi:hypothetical protein